MLRNHPDYDDPMARVGALCAVFMVFGLLIVYGRAGVPVAAVAAPGAQLEPLIVITATPSLPTAQPLQPTATVLPVPTAAPEVIVQYVEAPVYVQAPQPPLEAHYQTVAVPEGGMQVSIAPVGEQPIVSSIHVEGVEQPRPTMEGFVADVKSGISDMQERKQRSGAGVVP